MFNKMLNLPIDFFERTPTGEIVHDMYEIYKVRTFPDRPAVWHAAGFLCDRDLSADHVHGQRDHDGVVLAMCLLICLWLVAMLPTIRRKVGLAVQAETARGTHLVEAVHGIRAIKSLALDARQRHEWDVHVAKVAEAPVRRGVRPPT